MVLAVISQIMRLPVLLLLLVPSLASGDGQKPLLPGNPSLKPAPSSLEKSTFAERWRVRADLDGDGDEDLILSAPTSTFGNGGGSWDVYLNTGKGYLRMGAISAHPRALTLEPDASRINRDPSKRFHARIWVYLRAGGGTGLFGYYRLGTAGIENHVTLEIYPDDSGTETSRRLYTSCFDRSSIPMALEHSITSEEGEVTWRTEG